MNAVSVCDAISAHLSSSEDCLQSLRASPHDSSKILILCLPKMCSQRQTRRMKSQRSQSPKIVVQSTKCLMNHRRTNSNSFVNWAWHCWGAWRWRPSPAWSRQDLGNLIGMGLGLLWLISLFAFVRSRASSTHCRPVACRPLPIPKSQHFLSLRRSVL